MPITGPYADVIQQVANLYQLPWDLLQGQVLTESGGDAFAYRYEQDYFERYIRGKPAKGSPYGPMAACSVGLLQIMVETALEIGFDGRPEQLFDPKVGLAWGAKRMRNLWDWAGGTTSDYPKALSAYNAGPGNAVGPPFPNQAYVDRVYHLAGRTA